jgi:hypothetical protein
MWASLREFNVTDILSAMAGAAFIVVLKTRLFESC